jgi:hypothetical protein
MEKLDLATMLEIFKITLWGMLFVSGLFSGTIIIALAIDFTKDIKRDRLRNKKERQAQTHRFDCQYSVGIVKAKPNDDKTMEFFTGAKEMIHDDYR